MDKYDAINDPYCYPNSHVLINKANITDNLQLESFERQATALRFKHNLPQGKFDVNHYKQLHFHLFQDIYAWAGEYRTVRISKNSTMFCYPDYIEQEMKRVFTALLESGYKENKAVFITKASHFLAELNAIHPFREGNGRTQLSFLLLLAFNAGFSIDIEKLNPERFLQAMISSFKGDEAAIQTEISAIIV